MTNQVELQEKVRWEDLEVIEEQTYQERLAELSTNDRKREYEGCFDPYCGVDLSKPESEFSVFAFGVFVMQGVVLAFGIPAEDFVDALEGQARVDLEQELRFADIPVLDWREANERLPSIGEMVARVNAFCTPSRSRLTGGE